MEGIINLTTIARINNPVKLSRNGATVYGRVTKLLGNPIDGSYPRLEFTTPHGSTIESGVVWIRVLDSSELPILGDYEQQAIEAGKELYDGKLVSINFLKRSNHVSCT